MEHLKLEKYTYRVRHFNSKILRSFMYWSLDITFYFQIIVLSLFSNSWPNYYANQNNKNGDILTYNNFAYGRFVIETIMQGEKDM